MPDYISQMKKPGSRLPPTGWSRLALFLKISRSFVRSSIKKIFDGGIQMQVLVCIDDTDSLESIGTGKLAAKIIGNIEERGWGKCDAITRHQLYVHPDIPYTSHNSSMCFGVDLHEAYLEGLIDYASDYLLRKSADGSDPGLCVTIPGKLSRSDLLIDFGIKAKGTVLTKKEAYQLAGQLGVHFRAWGYRRRRNRRTGRHRPAPQRQRRPLQGKA
jgi:hypothetical protein